MVHQYLKEPVCIRNPWPGGFQTIRSNRDRYVRQYYERCCKNPNSKDWRYWPYMTGDAAVEAADGYYRILVRVDDVIHVSGHRRGTKEIEDVGDVTTLANPEIVDEIRTMEKH
jgi:acetyl-CoA synthetase